MRAAGTWKFQKKSVGTLIFSNFGGPFSHSYFMQPAARAHTPVQFLAYPPLTALFPWFILSEAAALIFTFTHILGL